MKKVRYAVKEDIDDWMEVVGSSVDGYPYLNEKDYICRLRNYIAKRHGIVLEKDGVIAGVMAFSVRSSETVHIEYLAVLPQNRKAGLYKILVSKLAEELFPGREFWSVNLQKNFSRGVKSALRLIGKMTGQIQGTERNLKDLDSPEKNY